MALPQNIAFTQPTEQAGNTSFMRVAGESNKQKKKLADLGAICMILEKELSDVKTGAKTIPLEKGNADVSEKKYQSAMAEMELILQMLQVLIAKYGNKRAESNGTISAKDVEEAKKQLKEITKKLHKLEEKQKHESFWDKLSHIAEDILGGLAVIGGLLLGQPELVVMGVLSIMAGSGLLNDATKGVSDMLVAMGMPKQDAKMIASVVMCVVIIVASVAACDPEEAVEEVAETATEDTSDAAEDAGTLKKLANQIKESRGGKLFKSAMEKLGPRGRAGIMAGSMSISSTDAVNNLIVGLFTFTDSPEEVKKWKKKHAKLLQDLEIVVEAVCMTAAMVTGIGAGSVAKDAADGEKLSVLAEKLGTSTTKLAKVLASAQDLTLVGGTAVEASATVREGTIIMQEGTLKEGLAYNQANLGLLKVCMEMLADDTSAGQRHLGDAEKAQKTDDRSATQLAKGVQEFAKVSTQNSPV